MLKRTRKKKIHLLPRPMTKYAEYACDDGMVTIWVPEKKQLTAERANWMLDKAKQQLLLEGFEDE